MADPVKIAIELEDKVSAGAEKMATVLRKANGQFASAEEKALRAAAASGDLGAKMKLAAQDIQEAATKAWEFGKTLAEKFIVPAIEAHDNIAMMRARLDALAGGTKAGGTVIKMLTDMREETGSTREELFPLAKQLLAMGTPVDKLKDKMLALASVQALDLKGGTAAYLKVQRALAAELVPSAKSLAMLSKSGISNAEVAKAMGKSLKDFNAELKAGRIHGKDMADAMDRVARAKGMEVMAAKSKTLEAAMNDLKEGLADVFADIDTKAIVGDIRDVAKSFGPATQAGKELRATVGGAFKSIAAAIPGILSGMGKMLSVASAIGDALDKASKAFGDISKMSRPAHQEATVDTNKMKTDKSGLDAMEKQAEQLSLKLMKATQNPFTAFSQDTLDMKSQLEVLQGEIAQTKKEIAAAGKVPDETPDTNAKGKEAGEAYAAGLNAAAPDAAAAGKNVGDAGKQGLDSSNKRASPPKEYVMRGKEAAQAFASGFEDHAAGVSSGFGRGAKASRAGARGAASGAAGGKVVHVNFQSGAIVVQGAGLDAQELSEQVMAKALERVALSRGLG